MKIISVSRRTDIPAFYSEWLLNRLRAGFCHWLTPFSQKVVSVSLAPPDCLALVFWTRNAAPLIPHLTEMAAEGYRSTFLYTILGYPRALEPHTPALEQAVQTFQALSTIVGPAFVSWRYDPIVISSITPPAFHRQQFATIARQLEGYTHRCIYSFLDMYGKTRRNLARLRQQQGVVVEPPTPALRAHLLADLADLAQTHGMHLAACCEDGDLAVAGIEKSHCVDRAVVRQLTGTPDLRLKPRPTRPQCGCFESVDIGSYNTCLAGCNYCYATESHAAAVETYTAHDPHDTILARPPSLGGVDLEGMARTS